MSEFTKRLAITFFSGALVKKRPMESNFGVFLPIKGISEQKFSQHSTVYQNHVSEMEEFM